MLNLYKENVSLVYGKCIQKIYNVCEKRIQKMLVMHLNFFVKQVFEKC